MTRTRAFLLAFCLLMLCMIAAGMAAEAGASYPTAPRYTDPYHHISGIIATSITDAPQNHPASQDLIQNLKSKIENPFAPPVFGANVDASLNNTANQNETTI